MSEQNLCFLKKDVSEGISDIHQLSGWIHSAKNTSSVKKKKKKKKNEGAEVNDEKKRKSRRKVKKKKEKRNVIYQALLSLSHRP